MSRRVLKGLGPLKIILVVSEDLSKLKVNLTKNTNYNINVDLDQLKGLAKVLD